MVLSPCFITLRASAHDGDVLGLIFRYHSVELPDALVGPCERLIIDKLSFTCVRRWELGGGGGGEVIHMYPKAGGMGIDGGGGGEVSSA